VQGAAYMSILLFAAISVAQPINIISSIKNIPVFADSLGDQA
jgi:hypothetical protein